MSVKLRLKRMGRTNAAFYRLNAIDSRSPRDGRVIEELGFYDPRNKDQTKQFLAKLDRCKHWLDVGAVPSETVSSLLKKSGLDHKQLRLPRPGKPKPPAQEPAKKEAKAPSQRRKRRPRSDPWCNKPWCSSPWWGRANRRFSHCSRNCSRLFWPRAFPNGRQRKAGQLSPDEYSRFRHGYAWVCGR